MSKVRSKSGLVSAGLLCASLAAGPAAAMVVISFSGTVVDVSGFGATPPSGVSVGDPVTGTLSYNASDAQGVESAPSDWDYTFNPSDQNLVTVTIGAQTWTTPLAVARVCDGPCNGDELSYGGVTGTSSGFPGFLQGGLITLQYLDSSDPFALIGGTALPAAIQDVDFGAVDGTIGTISSSSGSGIWAISYTMESSTLPVKATTWSQVKLLYARP
jgi:hypothetical protein